MQKMTSPSRQTCKRAMVSHICILLWSTSLEFYFPFTLCGKHKAYGSEKALHVPKQIYLKILLCSCTRMKKEYCEKHEFSRFTYIQLTQVLCYYGCSSSRVTLTLCTVLVGFVKLNQMPKKAHIHTFAEHGSF